VSIVTVGARREVDASPERVFTLLADLRRHWPLLGADLITADLVDGGAELMLRGPVPGLQRRVVTQVKESRPNELLRGEAVAGDTVAMIEWQLSENGSADRADVTFRARIEPSGLRDSMLVNAARPGLQMRCTQVLARLEAELANE
jgi:uncharacterized protein YndB with AHSA1/START domain